MLKSVSAIYIYYYANQLNAGNLEFIPIPANESQLSVFNNR